MLSLVNGQQRIEIRDYPPAKLALWKGRGCFTEVISFKTRLFVPIDPTDSVIRDLLA